VMTKYLNGSPFSVAMGGTDSKPKVCDMCGAPLKEVTYSINSYPVCKECFNKPKSVYSNLDVSAEAGGAAACC